MTSSAGIADAYTNTLFQRGNTFLGTRIPLLGGAMTWVSDATFVAALCNAGAFGTLACGAMDPSTLKDTIKHTKEQTQKPFGVNLIVMHPQCEALIEACLESCVPFIIFAGGIPSTAMIQRVKEHSSKVMAFAPSLGVAKKLIRSGIDALILEGMEAGGHIGKVSTHVLAQEILQPLRDTLPIFVGGGIGTGEGMLAYLEMGAAGVQMGTRFVSSQESPAHPVFKQAIIRAQARDAIVSPQLDTNFPVIPVRALENKGTEAFLKKQEEVINKFKNHQLTKEEAQLEIEHFWAGSLRRAVREGDVEYGSLMAGQSVSFVKEIESIPEIIQEICTQLQARLKQRGK